MLYKTGQKLNKWTFLVKQEYLVIWSQVLNDPNPIHLNNKKVEELGLGNKCINQGPANIAYILNCISSNFPEDQLINIKNKLNGNVFSDDRVTVEGQISDIEKKKDYLIISLNLNLHTQNQNSVLSSNALIRLPNHLFSY